MEQLHHEWHQGHQPYYGQYAQETIVRPVPYHSLLPDETEAEGIQEKISSGVTRDQIAKK